MKLEDFVKAAITFYQHNTHKRATYVKPDPKKNKFEVKCGRMVFDVFYHDRKHEAYIQYQDLDHALTYHCESPRNMANAMIRFPMIIQELKQLKKDLINKGKEFFNSLPRGFSCSSNEGFSIYHKVTQSMVGYIDVTRLNHKNFNTLSTNPVFTWQVFKPYDEDNDDDVAVDDLDFVNDDPDSDAIEETDLNQAFNNFASEIARLYLRAENKLPPV